MFLTIRLTFQIPFPALTFVKDLEITNQQVALAEHELIKTGNFINSNSFPHSDYVYNIRGQLFVSACSRQWRYYDEQYYKLNYPFHFQNHTDLMKVLKTYTKNQQKYFQSRTASWNGVIDPPFAQVLTRTTYGRTFNLLEMADLFNDKNLYAISILKIFFFKL